MSGDVFDPDGIETRKIKPGDITTGHITDPWPPGDPDPDLGLITHPPVFHYGHSHRGHQPHAVDWQWCALGVCAFVFLLMIVLSTLGVL